MKIIQSQVREKPVALAMLRNQILFVCFFVSYYIELTVPPVAGLNFANIGCLSVALTAIYLNMHLVRTQILWMLSAIGVFLAANAVLASYGAGPIGVGDGLFKKHGSAALQMFFSLISAYGAYLTIIQIPTMRVATIFRSIFFVILIGSILEVSGLIRPFTEAIQSLLYGTFYQANLRDLAEYGAVRPRFFTREPSLVGINGGFVLSIWILCRPNGQNRDIVESFSLLSLFSILLLIVVRSPTVIFFYMLSTVGLFFAYETLHGRHRTKIVVAVLVILLCGFLLLPIAILVGAHFDYVSQRLLRDPSTLLRVVGPPQIAAEVLKQHPWWGVGIGAYPLLIPYVMKIYGSSGIVGIDNGIFASENYSILMTNAFWEYWCWFGIGGGISLLYLLRRFLKSVGIVETLLPFFALALFVQNFGGAVICRTWFFFMCYAGIVFLWERRRTMTYQRLTGVVIRRRFPRSVRSGYP